MNIKRVKNKQKQVKTNHKHQLERKKQRNWNKRIKINKDRNGHVQNSSSSVSNLKNYIQR